MNHRDLVCKVFGWPQTFVGSIRCAAFIRCMAGLSGRRIAVAGCEWRLDQSIQQQLQAWIEVEAVRHGVAD